MVLKTTFRSLKILTFFTVLALFPAVGRLHAQTRVYASSVSAESHISAGNPSANAIDQDLATRARINASTGSLLGAPQYSGYLELQFPADVPANTTTYVKVNAEQEFLSALLGGSLGGLLTDLLGNLLTGHQYFTVEAKNSGGTTVLTGNSEVTADFAGPNLRVIIDPAGNYYLAITPTQTYNRIRITNRVVATLALAENTRWFDVYDAFYDSAPANCGTPAYTSYSGSGITLDLLQLGSAGVQNPQFAIDADATNHSTLSLGLLGVGSSIEQTVYFEGPSDAADRFSVRFRLAQTLLDLNVANNIRVITYNGGTQVTNQDLSTLLTLNLLNLQGGQITTIPINPGAPIDRVTVQFFSLVSASVAQNLDFYGVTRVPAPPTLNPATNTTVCSGSTASLLASTSAVNELRWYDAATGGTLLATVAAGSPFVTPALTANTTYYVAAARVGCTEESARLAVAVTINIVATPTTLNTTQEFCSFTLPTLAQVQVNEAGVVFYDAATGGNLLPLTTALTNGTIYYAALVNTVTNCESAVRLAITVNLNNLCGVTLNLKVMLQGALFGVSDGLMRDNLRQLGHIPLNQPYSSALNARFTHVNGGGNEVTTQAVLDANAGTGNAIVDWVFVEMRDAANSQTVIRTVSALVQRDGDVVAADGGPLNVEGLPGSFYVSVKHRNHFGALASQLLTVANDAVTLDFTTLTDANIYATTGYTGQEAMATVGSIRALYSGNANFDTQVKYDGAANDRQVAAGQVLSYPDNNAQILNFANATGYFSGDVNMDGKVLYDGANNDRQLILNIVITYPLNQNTLINYNGMFEQIPQ